MRLQIPTKTPLAFITLVGACGGAQSTDDSGDAYQVSLECPGDELSPEIIADLRDHGFVNATHFEADARGTEWMTSSRAVLDRLAGRLPHMPNAGFRRESYRAGQILVLTDSELTPETELLLITGWSDEPVAASEIPDPLGIIGYSGAVLQCTAAGLWEPLAHNDLSLAYSYMNIVGLRSGQTDHGTIHTVILQDVNPMSYQTGAFDFALVFGNQRAGAAVAEPNGYAYHYGSGPDQDWGPLSYLGQFYSVGYEAESYYAGSYSESAFLMEASNWFPLVGDAADGADDEFSSLFLAFHTKSVLSGYFDYDRYYDFDYDYDYDYDDYESPGLLQSLAAGSVFGDSNESLAIGSLYEDPWGGLGLSDADEGESGIGGWGSAGIGGLDVSGAAASDLSDEYGSTTIGSDFYEDTEAQVEPYEYIQPYHEGELYEYLDADDLVYVSGLVDAYGHIQFYEYLDVGTDEPLREEILNADNISAMVGGALRDLSMTSAPAQSATGDAEPTSSIVLIPIGGIGATSFSVYETELPAAFVLLLAGDSTSRCRRRGWSCRALPEPDQERFFDTELRARSVAGVWTTWQAAAEAAETLGLGDSDFLILGPDPMLNDQIWEAYFADSPASWNGEPERLDELLRTIHPRLRARVIVPQ